MIQRAGKTLFTCGICHATNDYRLDYDSDMPNNWFRIEDNACWFVVCSRKCLRAFVATLEEPPAADAVDPHADSTGKPSTRV